MTRLKNKTEQRVLALHRNFEKDVKGDPIFIIAEKDVETKYLSGTKITKFMNSLDSNITIRVTSQAYFGPVLEKMQERGANLQYCHWHNTNLSKGLSAEEIVTGYLNLDSNLFLPIKINPNITKLRKFVSMRAAVIDSRRACQLKFHAIARSIGYAKADDENLPAEDQLTYAGTLFEWKEKQVPLEKEITELAKLIPECIILNQVLGISDNSWITSATIIAYLGDLSRFTKVQSLRHYCGYHVTEGHAPKHERGKNITWNPKIRTALWSWADSMLKTKNPTWRPLYDEYLAIEKEQHLRVHPGCKTLDGHSGARARRKVVQKALKMFFLVANDLKDDQIV
jgi:hypothetical protein